MRIIFSLVLFSLASLLGATEESTVVDRFNEEAIAEMPFRGLKKAKKGKKAQITKDCPETEKPDLSEFNASMAKYNGALFDYQKELADMTVFGCSGLDKFRCTAQYYSVLFSIIAAYEMMYSIGAILSAVGQASLLIASCWSCLSEDQQVEFCEEYAVMYTISENYLAYIIEYPNECRELIGDPPTLPPSNH